MTTGSVRSSDADRRIYAKRSHAYNMLSLFETRCSLLITSQPCLIHPWLNIKITSLALRSKTVPNLNSEQFFLNI